MADVQQPNDGLPDLTPPTFYDPETQRAFQDSEAAHYAAPVQQPKSRRERGHLMSNQQRNLPPAEKVAELVTILVEAGVPEDRARERAWETACRIWEETGKIIAEHEALMARADATLTAVDEVLAHDL